MEGKLYPARIAAVGKCVALLDCAKTVHANQPTAHKLELIRIVCHTVGKGDYVQ